MWKGQANTNLSGLFKKNSVYTQDSILSCIHVYRQSDIPIKKR